MYLNQNPCTLAGGVTHTAPTTLDALSSIAGLKIFVFIIGIVFLGSAIAYGFYLLLQLGSGRLMLGIRLIKTANIALRDISYTGMLPVVFCGALFLLGMYAYVVGELLLNSCRAVILKSALMVEPVHLWNVPGCSSRL